MPPQFDFDRHNEEVAEVWRTYRAGSPIRVPIIIGANTRFSLLSTAGNPRKITFEDYFNDPATMLIGNLQHQDYVRHNLLQDAEMGLPKTGWGVGVDFQNTYEAAWFGCPIRFYDDQVPDTLPILDDDDSKNKLFDSGIPDPFTGGLMARNWEFYDYFTAQKEAGYTYRNLPLVSVGANGFGTDGPLTVACNIRGASEFLADLLEDPEYAHKLLDYITEATIVRIQAYRKRVGQPLKTQGWGFADDSVQLISTSMYRDMIFPYHKRLIDTFSEGGPNSIHLCGNATRHFPFISQNLNIRSFDTGFPVDFTAIREQLGPDVEILGGPSVPFLQSATPAQVREEVKRICESGIRIGKRFVLREGNNISPDVPTENLVALYESGKEFGRY
ncbi:MAG TPA: uroporphyrinogen decarboxylase family protein [Capsulimonadaceae bacterium]|jgi:hypothetical protein